MNLRQIKQGNIQFPVLMQDSLMSLNICPTQYDTYLGLGFYEIICLVLLVSILEVGITTSILIVINKKRS